MTPDELSDVLNLRYIATPSGVGLTNRPGMVKCTTTPIAGGSYPIKDLHKYVNTSGTVKYMAVCNSAAYMSTGGTPPNWSFSSLGTLAGARGRMVNFAGKCIVADGAAPKKYDGASWGTCTSTSGSPPNPTFLAVHGDRLFANDGSKKNGVFYCNVRDPEDWNTANAAGTIYLSESNEITAFSKFYDKLLLHGIAPKNVMALTGTTPTDIAVTRAIPGAAAVGPDQAIVLSNDVLFMDAPGIISFRAWQNYGDIEQAIVSDPVSNVIMPMVANTVVAGRHPIDQQAWFYDGSTNPAILYVYDAQYGIWTMYHLELGTTQTPTCIADFDGVLYVGTSDGHVWRMDTSNTIFQDGAIPYGISWKGNAEDFGTLRKKLIRRYLPGVTMGAGATGYACLYKDLGAVPLVQVSVSGPPLRIVGTMTAGSDTINTSGFTPTYLVNEAGGIVINQLLNFEATYLQIGMSTVLCNNARLTINPHVIEAAVLSRY